jgi:GTP cyclohydrolase II
MTKESKDIKPLLALLGEGVLATEFGDFKMCVFHDGRDQAVVLYKGRLSGQEKVPCRIHSECLSSHVFSGTICDCKEQMIKSQQLIRDTGKGLIIYLEQEGRGCGAAAHVATLDLKTKGIPQPEAYRLVGFPNDTRNHQILWHKVRCPRLLK